MVCLYSRIGLYQQEKYNNCSGGNMSYYINLKNSN